jgi:acyl carrier protein
MEDAILARLTEIFREVFGDRSLSLSRGTTASDIKGWDSLAHITLMLSVQRAFRVRLSAAETSQLKDVGALADLLGSKQRPS